jgi:hypothetical protein
MAPFFVVRLRLPCRPFRWISLGFGALLLRRTVLAFNYTETIFSSVNQKPEERSLRWGML